MPLDVSSLKRPLSKESLTKIDPVHQKPHDRHPGAPRQFFLVHARPARHDGAQAVEVTVGVTVCLNSTALFCQSFGRTVFMKNKKNAKKKKKNRKLLNSFCQFNYLKFFKSFSIFCFVFIDFCVFLFVFY